MLNRRFLLLSHWKTCDEAREKLFIPGECVSNSGAMPVRSSSTVRPGSGWIAYTTASCGFLQTTCIPVPCPSPRPYFSTYARYGSSYCYWVFTCTESRHKEVYLNCGHLYMSTVYKTVVSSLCRLPSAPSAGVLCWQVNELRPYWLFLYVSSSHPMCNMIFTPLVVGIVRRWISRTNKVRLALLWLCDSQRKIVCECRILIVKIVSHGSRNVKVERIDIPCVTVVTLHYDI
jgi:hypothetical protein